MVVYPDSARISRSKLYSSWGGEQGGGGGSGHDVSQEQAVEQLRGEQGGGLGGQRA